MKRLRLVGQVFANALARKRAEEALGASEARLAAGADLAGLAFYEVDFAGRPSSSTTGFATLCGVPPEREAGPRPRAVLDGAPASRTTATAFWSCAEQLHDGRLERLNTEYRYLHPTRGEMWIHHMARVAAARRRRAGGPDLRRPARHHGAPAARGGPAAVVRGDRAAEGPAPGGERLPQGRDQGRSSPHGEVTGQSAAIQKVLRQVEQVAPTDSSVLVRGETGTGKELVAQAIHRLSPRRSHLMVKVNCAALPSGLVESELFGREKGAFTGALTRQVGRFEVADGSTLFLDEVGELSLEVQAKLLRVLETGEFERLGSPQDHQGRRAPDRGHQPRPAGGGPQGPLPGGPLLPPERLPDPRAAAARAGGGHPAAGLDLPGGVLLAHGQEDHPGAAPDDGGAPAPSLAGQRPRAAERDRARGHRHHAATPCGCRLLDEAAPAGGGAADAGRLRARAHPAGARAGAAGTSRGRRARPRRWGSTPRPSTAA